MRFIVEIPEMDTNFTQDEYWQKRKDELDLRDLQQVLIKVWPRAKVMIDDRPD